MSSAGYSPKPLAEKLGLKAGIRAAVLHPPPHYAELIGERYTQVEWVPEDEEKLDFIHLFVTYRAELEDAFPQATGRLVKEGTLWVSWPKQSSAYHRDLNETLVREIGLAQGLVDVKIAAIDRDWSGLKFVYRLKDRK
ncbi:MAG: DUF3052 family protein [Chloroflexi bacterium]|nr:DUF3052 family protein [Chloroflexota bacterium]